MNLSTLELKFLQCWELYGIPDSRPEQHWKSPEITYEIKAGAIRQYEWDFAWPLCRILVETHGMGGHHTMAGVARDCRKLRSALAAGYIVIPITTQCLGSTQKQEDICHEIATIIMQHGRWGD